MPWHMALTPAISEEELQNQSLGERMYTINCVACHDVNKKGNPNSGYPSLVSIERRMDPETIKSVITNGKGMMPPFSKFSEEELNSLLAYVSGNQNDDLSNEGSMASSDETEKIPYQISGYTKFLDKKGYPAVRPPWGTLNAIDMNTGEYLWKITYGEHPELMDKGIPVTGTESYGGPVVTASGLLFIAGTKDKKLRAYDKKNGKLLWETKLPAAAFATPSTYEVNGRQYVVIACGGTKLGAPGGDSFIAFALPEHLTNEQ